MKYLLLTSWIFCSFFVSGQETYNYDWKKESLIILPSSLMIGTSYLLDAQKSELSDMDIISATAAVNYFDRVALKFNSASANLTSDLLFYGLSAAPLIFLSNNKLKGKRKGYLLMLGETVMLNTGVTFLVKSATDRRRPYFYNDAIGIEERRDLDARKSFFSGHTSHTAAMAFFIASVNNDINPDSFWNNLIWAGAVLLPASTAYARVRAGKHYPSDVIVGYFAGAGAGLLIPYLHRKGSNSNNSLKLNFAGNGFKMTYQLK